MNNDVSTQSVRTKNLIRSSLLLALAIVLQLVGSRVPQQINQFLVGPAVNAILIISAYICGKFWGISIGILTPLLAWLVGQLAAPFAPFIPFIMIGNAIFVLSFSLLKDFKKFGAYLGIIIGAVLKYVFLFLSASKLVGLLNLSIPKKLAGKLILAMGIPQLITALVGGAVALIIIKILESRNIK